MCQPTATGWDGRVTQEIQAWLHQTPGDRVAPSAFGDACTRLREARGRLTTALSTRNPPVETDRDLATWVENALRQEDRWSDTQPGGRGDRKRVVTWVPETDPGPTPAASPDPAPTEDESETASEVSTGAVVNAPQPQVFRYLSTRKHVD